ncbi:MAG: thiol:disulfide interchange protein DsbD, partial [Bacteriovoracaceae bacterium]
MKLFSTIFFIFVSLSLRADNSVPDDVVKFGAQLLSHDSKTYLVLNYEAAPKWHTYWKNPGDAGLPTSTDFKLSGEAIDIKPLEWPSPNRYFEQGNMLAFGYAKKYSFFFEPSLEQLK